MSWGNNKLQNLKKTIYDKDGLVYIPTELHLFENYSNDINLSIFYDL